MSKEMIITVGLVIVLVITRNWQLALIHNAIIPKYL